MNRGATLIEVLVALLICMFLFTAAARLAIVSLRSGAFSEALTNAAVIGHTKLASLVNQPITSPELAPKWHQDKDNPISRGGKRFYRFWKVDDVEIGKKVVLFIAWDGDFREKAANFGSLEDLQKSRCSRISFSDVLVGE